MRRIILVLTVAAVMAAMMVVMAVPAFAAYPWPYAQGAAGNCNVVDPGTHPGRAERVQFDLDAKPELIEHNCEPFVAP